MTILIFQGNNFQYCLVALAALIAWNFVKDANSHPCPVLLFWETRHGALQNTGFNMSFK